MILSHPLNASVTSSCAPIPLVLMFHSRLRSGAVTPECSWQMFNSLSTCMLRVLMLAEPSVMNTSSTIISFACTYT